MSNEKTAEEMTKDELYSLAKEEVQYDRQIALFDITQADTVLQFWILGFTKGSNLAQPFKDQLAEKENEIEKTLIDFFDYIQKNADLQNSAGYAKFWVHKYLKQL